MTRARYHLSVLCLKDYSKSVLKSNWTIFYLDIINLPKYVSKHKTISLNIVIYFEALVKPRRESMDLPYIHLNENLLSLMNPILIIYSVPS